MAHALRRVAVLSCHSLDHEFGTAGGLSTASPSSSQQGNARILNGMATFEVKLRDGTVETIERADAYQPDGQLTTFFAFEDGRSTIDCWSVRVASIRTSEIVAVWRRERPASTSDERSDRAAAA